MNSETRERRSLADACWSMLRDLRTNLRDVSAAYCSVRLGDEHLISFNELMEPVDDSICLDLVFEPGAYTHSPDRPCFILRDLITVEVLGAAHVPAEIRDMLALYLPYAAAALRARNMRRSLAVSHFAQTLDGRIATVTGDSRWIGNDANLVHAHRMRALCDAVLVGTGTLRRDTPRLNVRRVPGENPMRVVLGECESRELDCLTEACPDQVLVLCGGESPASTEFVRYLNVPGPGQSVPGPVIMEHLYEQGLFSVYVEGGARTTSRLLSDKAIDIVQLHISPIIMGSGKDAFQMEEVHAVDASLKFQSHVYVPVDDGIMFVGVPD